MSRSPPMVQELPMSDREGGSPLSPVPDEYPVLLAHLVTEVRSAQQRAVLAVNRELILLY